jgi:hypothetical protein
MTVSRRRGWRTLMLLGMATAAVACSSDDSATTATSTTAPPTDTTAAPSTTPATTTTSGVPATESTTTAPPTTTAEPPRPFPVALAAALALPPGETSVTESGMLADGTRALFVIDVDAGQVLDVSVGDDADALAGMLVALYRSDGVVIGGGARRVVAVAPVTGTYGISVVSAAEPTPGAEQPYELSVAIQAGPATCEAPCTAPGWELARQWLTAGDAVVDARVPRFFDAATGAWLVEISDELTSQLAPPAAPSQLELMTTAIRSDVVLAGPSLLSVALTATSYVTGAAHPWTDITAFVWDVGRRARLGASDILVDEGGDAGAAAWARLRPALVDALVAYQESIDGVGRDQIEAIDFDEPSAYALAPSATGLRVGFSQCQILPCAFGTATVEIPASLLGGIVRDDVLAAAAEPHSSSI